MKAILLAAGEGTRLRPLTFKTPKCLVPINGKPLLEFWLETLSQAGVNDFLINTHYLNNKVEEFLSRRNEKIKLSHEEVLLGTAGTLYKNANFFGDEDGIFMHSDNFCKTNLNSFIQSHKERPRDCLITMMVFRTTSPESCGIVTTDKGVVTSYHEKAKNAPGNLANGAIYILSKQFLTIFKENYSTAKDFSKDVIGDFIGQIFTHEVSEKFLDIGTPETYEEANLTIKK